MIDKDLEARIKEGKLSRRDFLKLGLGGAAFLLYACKKKKTPTGTDTPGVPVNYTGSMRYLIGNSSVNSGKLIFNGTTEITISGGSYTISNSDNLTAGTYNVRVESDNGYPRETRAHLSKNGLYTVRGNLPLDNVIETSAIDANVYNNWITSAGSERWFTNKPKFFWYDRSLWRGTGTSIEIIDDNYNVDLTTISSIETTVNNHVSQYTANFVNNPVLLKESQSNERPDPNRHPKGWIIYLAQEDAIFGIDQGHIPDGSGDIYFGIIAFRPGSYLIYAVSIETAQALGIGQTHNSSQILTGTNPSELTKIVAKIIYNRAPHHKMFDGVDRE